MFTPKNADIYVRISDAAAANLVRRANRAQCDLGMIVESILSQYLDHIKDGLRPVHLYARTVELKQSKFRVSLMLSARLAQVMNRTGLSMQDIVRAAITRQIGIF